MNKWAWVDAPLAATSSSSQNAVGLTQLRFKLSGLTVVISLICIYTIKLPPVEVLKDRNNSYGKKQTH